MKIESTRFLPDRVLSRFRIRDMRYDEVIVAHTETIAEYNSAMRNIKMGIKDYERPDGMVYKIQSLTNENKIVVSLISKNKDNERVDENRNNEQSSDC